MESFFTGAVAGYGIAVPVGAIAILIIRTGMQRGLGPAASAGAGAATADLVYATIAVVAGAAVAGAVESFAGPLRYASAAVLVAMAAYGLVGIRRPEGEPVASTPTRADLAGFFGRFLGLTIVNPATVVYFTAFTIGSGVTVGFSAAQGIWFVTGAFLASLSWQLLLAFLGSAARRALSDRFRIGAIVAGNVMVLGLAVAIIVR